MKLLRAGTLHRVLRPHGELTSAGGMHETCASNGCVFAFRNATPRQRGKHIPAPRE
jgi:hypothetical protein